MGPESKASVETTSITMMSKVETPVGRAIEKTYNCEARDEMGEIV